MKRIAILFSGEGSNLKYILDNMHNVDLEVVVAITNNPKAKGLAHAKEHKIPYLILDSNQVTRDEFDYLIVERLIQYNPDLTVLAGFMRKVTPYFLRYIKSINLHPSFLPLHKGLNAIEKSYFDDLPYGGITIHHVSEELDAGEIIFQEKIYKDNLSLDEFKEKVNNLEKPLLEKGIKIVLDS